MLHRLFPVALAASLGSAALAVSASAAPVEWQPIGKWVFDTEGERCAAAQTYASGKQRVTVGFKLRPMSESVALLVQVPGETVAMEIEQIGIDFGHGSDRRQAVVGRSVKPDHLLFEIGATRDELSQLADSQSLSLSVPHAKFKLPVAGLGSTLSSLDSCMADLLARWGLSKDAQLSLAQFPEPERNPASYVSSDDYPPAALRRRAIGAVEARVTVDRDGSASDCRIVRSSGHKDIDEMTCTVAVRARFKPAVDREGKPVTSPYFFSIRWLIGKPS